MKIVRFMTDAGKVTTGSVENTLDEARVIEGDIFAGYEVTGSVEKIAKLMAPIAPVNIMALGLNYGKHADETGIKKPESPVMFIKTTNTVIGHGDNIVLPEAGPDEVDYEVELVIVIGKTCRHVSQDEAIDYAFGYTVGNDVSARDCQLREDTQWARGKSFDTFCPLGPWIETDIDPENVGIKSVLNGETMQESNTNMLIFPCAELISYISRIATLRPGTVIMTGTPSGVGFKRQPPVFLRDGDTIEMTVEGIGTLSNPVVAE